MFAGGVPDPYASLTVIAGAFADFVIGIAIAVRRTTLWGLYAALAISVACVMRAFAPGFQSRIAQLSGSKANGS